MTSYAYFMIAFLTVVLIGLLSGCTSSAGRTNYKMTSTIISHRSTEDNFNYSRLIAQQRIQKENAVHELWVSCIKQRGLDSFSCPN